jgi:hypothetical protein
MVSLTTVYWWERGTRRPSRDSLESIRWLTGLEWQEWRRWLAQRPET